MSMHIWSFCFTVFDTPQLRKTNLLVRNLIWMNYYQKQLQIKTFSACLTFAFNDTVSGSNEGMVHEHFTLVLHFHQASINDDRLVDLLKFDEPAPHHCEACEVELSRFTDLVLEHKDVTLYSIHYKSFCRLLTSEELLKLSQQKRKRSDPRRPRGLSNRNNRNTSDWINYHLKHWNPARDLLHLQCSKNAKRDYSNAHNAKLKDLTLF